MGDKTLSEDYAFQPLEQPCCSESLRSCVAFAYTKISEDYREARHVLDFPALACMQFGGVR